MYSDSNWEGGFPTSTSSKFENELRGNEGQFDDNKVQFVKMCKFRSM